MLTFFVRIHPARSNFLSDMADEDREIMRRHYDYWKGKMAEGHLLLAGPVPIEPGTFGILIIRAQDAREAEDLVRHDPSVIDHVTDYEVYPLKLALYEGVMNVRPNG